MAKAARQKPVQTQRTVLVTGGYRVAVVDLDRPDDGAAAFFRWTA